MFAMRWLVSVVIAAGLTLGLGRKAVAQEAHDFLYPRFEAGFNGTLLVLGENIRIDNTNTSEPGTEFDAEDLLGVSKTTLQPRAALRWRPGRRHELEVGFLRAVRNAEKTLIDTVAVSDTTFAAGARLNSSLRTSQAFLTYRYAFTARENTQIGAAVGLGALFLRIDLDAIAATTTGGADTTTVVGSRTTDFTGPTGSVGVYGRFRLGDRWFLESDLRAVYVKIDNFKAGVVEGGAAGRYFFNQTWGAELGYALGYYTVEIDPKANGGLLDTDFVGKVNYVVNGFRGGVVVQF
jgi:hypothetical protein